MSVLIAPSVLSADFANLQRDIAFGVLVEKGIQQTMQDPNDPTSPVLDDQVAWFSHPTSALVAASSNQQGYYGTGTLPVPIFARVLLNSGTGSVSTVFRQVYTG